MMNMQYIHTHVQLHNLCLCITIHGVYIMSCMCSFVLVLNISINADVCMYKHSLCMHSLCMQVMQTSVSEM